MESTGRRIGGCNACITSDALSTYNTSSSRRDMTQCKKSYPEFSASSILEVSFTTIPLSTPITAAFPIPSNSLSSRTLHEGSRSPKKMTTCHSRSPQTHGRLTRQGPKVLQPFNDIPDKYLHNSCIWCPWVVFNRYKTKVDLSGHHCLIFFVDTSSVHCGKTSCQPNFQDHFSH